jgi:phosphatidylinositol-3-phosphatase
VRRLLAPAAAAIGLLAAGPAAAGAALPPVKHVFVIILENENADSTFGAASKAPYLARTLRGRGQFLPRYYGVTHESLGNYIALVSGQGSNPQTQSDCQLFTELFPGTMGADGQAIGQGCVHPQPVKTVADQLAAGGRAWRGYMEDMGHPCRHPAVGSHDDTQIARPNDQYAARHNPFVYFHSIIDSPVCARNDLPLERLPGDLRRRETTASYSFISPDLCNDAHDEPCVNGDPGGLKSANRFLMNWVPRILGSPGYRAGGLLVITFDEAEASGSEADASACCGEPQFPNTPNNGGRVMGPGGGRAGAVLLSPFVRAGSSNTTAYNHFSFLRSVEDLFGLTHLGFAARPGLKPFGPDVFNAGPPVLRLPKIKPGVFRAKAARRRRRNRGRRHPRGTRISYVLSQPATVRFRLERARKGRLTRRRGRCVRDKRSRRRLRRCTRWRRLKGSFATRGITGANSLPFNGRWRGHKLRRGRYRLVAVPLGFAGAGAKATRRFRIVRR